MTASTTVSTARVRQCHTLVWNSFGSLFHRNLYIHFLLHPSEDEVEIVYKRCSGDGTDTYKELRLEYANPESPSGTGTVWIRLFDGNSPEYADRPRQFLNRDHARALWKKLTLVKMESPHGSGWTLEHI
jgi:hypothetical protein